MFAKLFQEERIVTETEIVREEIIEEVIEYEYEVVGNKRTLVGEKNLGKTVTVQVGIIFQSSWKFLNSFGSYGIFVFVP